MSWFSLIVERMGLIRIFYANLDTNISYDELIAAYHCQTNIIASLVKERVMHLLVLASNTISTTPEILPTGVTTPEFATLSLDKDILKRDDLIIKETIMPRTTKFMQEYCYLTKETYVNMVTDNILTVSSSIKIRYK